MIQSARYSEGLLYKKNNVKMIKCYNILYLLVSAINEKPCIKFSNFLTE